MFCKWCGGTLSKTDAKCKRCGKEVPALSDCGGFYDLIPKAKVNTEETPIVQSVSPMQELQQQAQIKQHKDEKYKRNYKRKGFIILTAVMTCCFALVFLSLFSLQNEIRQYADSISRLRTEQGEAILEEQHIKINLDLQCGENNEGISSKVDLGECADVISTVLLFDDLNTVLTGIRYELGDNHGVIEVQISQEVVETDENSISTVFTVNEEEFGAIDGEVSYQWRYRTETNAEWTALDKDIFEQEDGEEQSSLSYSVDKLRELMGENDKDIKLQCILKRVNTEGGILTITIDNIVISPNTLKNSSNNE